MDSNHGMATTCKSSRFDFIGQFYNNNILGGHIDDVLNFEPLATTQMIFHVQFVRANYNRLLLVHRVSNILSYAYNKICEISMEHFPANDAFQTSRIKKKKRKSRTLFNVLLSKPRCAFCLLEQILLTR
ncbi:hypothetical protein PUN28_013348 [Cardiocondyla obscurior]|uniref:Uncharacterized protein n=1 Tax=Cardiocondyla obscurior TaxID=286306 RepID=A0AAW2FAH7_9HYME